MSDPVKALEQAARAFRAIYDRDIADRDEQIRQLLTGEAEASKIIPAGLTGCDRCGIRRAAMGGFLGDWSCQHESCPAGRPPKGVTVAEALRMWRDD